MTITICKVQNAPVGAIYVGRPMPRYTTKRPIDPALLAAIHRGSPLHNPYRPAVGFDAIGAFKVHLWDSLLVNGPAGIELKRLIAYYQAQGAIILACWCADQPRAPYLLSDGRLDDTPRADRCHADAIAAAIVRLGVQRTVEVLA